MVVNQAVPEERTTQDFSKSLKEVKDNCGKLLEQIAALQLAHEEALAGISVSEDKDVGKEPPEAREATAERPLSLTTIDFLKKKEPEEKAPSVTKPGLLEKILHWFRPASSQADPRTEVAVKSFELPVKDECEPATQEPKVKASRPKDPDVSGKTPFSNCCPQSQALVQRIVASLLFKAIVVMAIIANAIWLAFLTDWRLRNAYAPFEGREQETESMGVDLAFAIWFLIEIALRCFAEGKDFFVGSNLGWNIFDSLIVLEAWVSLFYELIQLTQLRILGVLRLARVTGRIVRMVKTPKALRRARTMMIAILNCFVDLFWSILVIGLILFAYGVFLSQGAVDYFDSLSSLPPGNLTITQQEDLERVKGYFGSMQMIMISLWPSKRSNIFRMSTASCGLRRRALQNATLSSCFTVSANSL
mmetsp:Transcript_18348/g.21351  ORF Transcript_18348/g.21351 Transcript_18348/m.21351 type:complete len:418 (+) Transcript_18348:53-1306(+)